MAQLEPVAVVAAVAGPESGTVLVAEPGEGLAVGLGLQAAVAVVVDAVAGLVVEPEAVAASGRLVVLHYFPMTTQLWTSLLAPCFH